MSKYLVIVESPAKTKKIQQFLGKEYNVVASNGCIVDLDPKQLSINTDTMTPKFSIIKTKNKIVKDLKLLAKNKTVIIATDKDTEGEAIGWHISNILKLQNPLRVIFTEITKQAIIDAFQNPTTINMNKVHSQICRRVEDRLTGYKVSPYLQRYFNSSYKKGETISAGRVQSIANRLVVDKEEQIKNFSPSINFLVKAKLLFENSTNNIINTKLFEIITNKNEILKIINKGIKNKFIISNLETENKKTNPKPPFITSTLQQDINLRFGLNAKTTMLNAQKLYEDGYITYMRTDSTNLSNEFINNAKKYIEKKYGNKYYKKHIYSTKSNAKTEEAHEAIRPTNLNFDQSKILNPLQRKIYDLIFKRTVASQMSSYEYEETKCIFQIQKCKKYNFISKNNKCLFDGFRKVYQKFIDPNKKDDDDLNDENSSEELNDVEINFKNLQIGNIFILNDLFSIEKYKSAPPRYTEGTLIKKLSTEGYGRPSTYATIVSHLIEKKYADIKDISGINKEVIKILYRENEITESTETIKYGSEKKKIKSTQLGIDVNKYLIDYFNNVINYERTKLMEYEIEDIENGNIEWKELAHKHYKTIEDSINIIKESNIVTNTVVKNFVGKHPINGNEIYAYIGKYGPIVSELQGKNKTPKYAKILTDINSITLDEAVKLLEFPKVLGLLNDKEIIIHDGKYGYYAKYDDKNHSLKNIEDIDSVTIDMIKEIIETTGTNGLIRKINDQISIYNGPHGYYLKTNKQNYSIPGKHNIEDINYELACYIIKNRPRKKYNTKKNKQSEIL